ncbi:sodium-coupled monocarboxylate transporter 1-like isoform X2 [Biomphalaria glabrata]|uniref:Sodium-coupled monocarboxylate transporter 1-like isoform X2 n=1 Tax=Biomphalaria glabrata TaxID=6526 RepID=A0A9W2ZRB1_BIOGL|nr:sodium-coupled monocarboxylate transporter 1-like isoform X2 [Biomphalaria glabrata]
MSEQLPSGYKEPFYKGEYSFNTGRVHQFTWVDYLIFAAMLAISASIGVFHAIKDRKKNLDNYLMAGRQMSPIPVGLSLLASFMSAITLLGNPAEIYLYSIMYFWIGVGYFLCIAGASHIYLPMFYQLQVTSAYEGGMKAVLFADSFQVLTMMTALLAVLIKGGMVIGGLGPAWESLKRTNRYIWDDTTVDPSVRHTVWSLAIGGYFTWVAIFGVNQTQVQRAVTTPSLTKAKIAMWMNFPGKCFILFLCCFIGIYMSAFYENCDPIKAKFISDSNQVLPMFVMDVLSDQQGLPGLFIAGLFSGALSTLASGLNSLSAAVFKDVIGLYWKDKFNDRSARILSILIVIIFGAILLGLAYVASLLGNVLQAALSLFGIIGGPLLGVFTLGMFFPWANYIGAFCGLFGSLILLFWIGVGAAVYSPPNLKAFHYINNCNLSVLSNDTIASMFANVTKVIDTSAPAYGLYRLSYMYYSMTAVLATVTIGLVVSFITGYTKPQDVNPRLICPFFDVIFPFCFLPECIRKPLRFGIVHTGVYGEPEIVDKESKSPDKVQSVENHINLALEVDTQQGKIKSNKIGVDVNGADNVDTKL